MTKQLTVYDEVTQTIIAQLEAGTAPWVKPWQGGDNYNPDSAAIPYNLVTGRRYSGVNVLLLWLAGPGGEQGYLTFKQAESIGARVRKGSKGFRIVYASTHTKRIREDDGTEAFESYSFLKRHTVFHWTQIDDLPEKYRPAARPAAEPVAGGAAPIIPDAFQFWVDNTRADIRVGGGRACYKPGPDLVCMPPLASFRSAEDYKATLLHELVHWSGDRRRLDRTKGKQFGDHDYAREELVAELGAAFLCADLGVVGQLQHAEYIASWIKVLKADNRAVFKAASAASKAAEYLHKLQETPRSRALVPAAVYGSRELIPV